MARLKQMKAPAMVEQTFKAARIRLKHFKRAKDFEKVLLKFVNEQTVLHLATSKNDTPRATPLEYRNVGLTFYILSEGGKKFVNLKANKKVSFSLANVYDSRDDFWGAKGIQAWGRAKVYSKKDNPRKFAACLKKMKVLQQLKKLGVKELPKQFHYRIIEIAPDQIKYGAVREGVYNVTWYRK
jgi:hypothetical protein